MITLDQAKALKRGNHIYLFKKHGTNADGTPQRFRVSGMPKTWKRSPERVEVPLMRGLREHARLTEQNLQFFTLNEEEA